MTSSLAPLTALDDLSSLIFDREHDIGSRKPFAEYLTKIIDNSDENNVIAIDAAWGQGKTHFLDRYQKFLEQGRSRYRQVRIDSFENDYIDEPFTIITAHLADLLKDDKKTRFLDAAKNIGKLYSPKVISALFQIGITAASKKLGLEDAGEILAEAISDGTESYFDEEIKKHENAKQAQTDFYEKLAEVAKDGKIVIFIDELDRCKPNFALALIERLKHFFKIQGLVFVLFINRDQLERYVNSVYATGEPNNEEYLYKFISMFLKLPTNNDTYDIKESSSYQYASRLLSTHKQVSDNLPLTIAILSKIMKISMRDIEKICDEIRRTANPSNIPEALLAFSACIKIKHRNLFQRIILEKDRNDSTREIRDIINHIENIDNNGIKHITQLLPQAASGFNDAPSYRINSGPHNNPYWNEFQGQFGYPMWEALLLSARAVE